ncbi:MAG: hypothetical protein K6G31_03910, partial [Paludibacteraceae bacterium]|nr:hypothetical protein [Paludibacteraceae bacterium]
TVNSKAYSCEGRTDGRFTFVAWPWDIEDSAAVLKDGNIGLKDFKPEVKDGKAYFELKGQGAGVYTLVTTDLCGREESKENNFTDFSAKNGRLTVGVDFDAEAAKCDAEKRIFKVTATGGTAPYIYTITKGGVTVQTTETTENKSFNSQLLTDGTYVVTVTDKTDCKAVYDKELTIKPIHTMKADMREVACGDGKSVMISTLVDGGETSATKFVAVDEAGKEYQPSSVEDGIVLFENVPASTTLKGLIAEVDGCKVYAEMGMLPLDETALAEAKVTVNNVIDECCYDKKNGGLKLSYTGPKSLYDVAMRLVGVNGTTGTINTPNKRGTNLTFEFENLAPGEYELYLVQKVGSCDAGTEPKKIQEIKIGGIAAPFKIDDSSLEYETPTCLRMKKTQAPNGYGKFNVSNWYEKLYTVEAYVNGEKKSLLRSTQYEGEGSTATIDYSSLNGGNYMVVTKDICNNSDTISFKLDSIYEPKLTWAQKQDELYCNRKAVNFERNAHVGLIFNGGDKGTGRLVLDYPEGEPVYKSYDALGYVHFSAAEKAGAELLEDKTSEIEGEVIYYMDSLSYGKYTMKYICTVEGCSDYAEYVFQTKEPNPIRSLIATAPVTCMKTETAEFSVIPNGEYYKPKYVAVGDAENLGEKMLNNLNGDTEYWADGAFKGVKTIAIATKNSDGKLNYEDAYSKLRETIKKEGGEPRSFPLTDFWQPLKKIGASMYGDTVREYWIGFANMPGQVYYLVTTDANDCRFVEEINLTASPKAPLKIDNLEYLAEKEADAACDAKTHRVKLAISGGWRGGYVVGIRDVNKMEEEDEEEVIKEIEEGAEDKDYGGAATSLTYQPGDTLTYNADSTAASYKSAILQPGTYMVTVVDRKGCIDTAEQIVEVKSHIDVKAEVGINLCDQNAGNFFYPEATFNKPYNGGSIVAYAIRYENTNVGDSIYVNEMKEENGRKVLENVPSGIIGLFAYDENGCSGYDTFFVKKKEITLLHFLALDQQKTRCYGSDDGEISFNLSGGYWPYTRFSLQKKDENENVLIDEEKNSTKAVQWFVEKKDSIFTTNEGKIDTSVTSSHVPSGKDFAFNVNVGDTFKLSDKFVYGGLLAGNYVMRVTDHEGCRDSLMFTIEQPDLIQFDLKTSPICPNDSARIFPTSVKGGYPPYTYAVAESKEQAESLIAEDFGTEDHVPIKVNKSGNNFFYVVRDTNDCRIIKDPSDVKTDTLKDVYQDALAARYHDLSDVLVVSDVTNLNNAKPKVDYDSCKVEVVILDPETHEPDPYSNFEALMMPKELYTYGVKPKEKEMDGDSLEIWDGIKIARPQDFIPADIAAGVQTKEDYAKNYASMVQPVKDRLQKIENSIKDLEKKQAKLAEEGKELSQQQKEELADLKESHKLCADTVHMKSRQLCTVDMIKGHFEKLEQDEPIKRQTFFKFVHDESTINVDSIDFIVRVTSYVGGCSYVMEKNYLSMYVDGRSDSLYGKTSGKEIISTALSENPVNQGTPTELHLKLGKPARELDLDISYYNVLGEKVKASETINEEVSKDSEGNYNYTVAVPTDDFGNSSLIIISITTKHERKVERLLINNIGE